MWWSEDTRASDSIKGLRAAGRGRGRKRERLRDELADAAVGAQVAAAGGGIRKMARLGGGVPYQRCQDHNVALLHQNGTLDVKRKKPMMVFSPPILAPLPIIGGMNWDE